MINTFAKTKKKLMVLLIVLAVVAIVATVVLVAISRANANVVTVANESELNDVLAAFRQGKYSDDTTVRLKNDISLSGSLDIDSTLTMDLNGKALCYEGSEIAPVITVTSGKLTLVDNSKKASGLVTGGTNGGIVVDGGSLALNGGTISGNVSESRGAGVFVAEGSAISVSGAPVVSGNTVDGAESNLYLPGDTNVVVGDLSAAANIGVTLDSKRIFTEGYAASTASDLLNISDFSADADGSKLTVVNSEIMAIAAGDKIMVGSKIYQDFEYGWGQIQAGDIVTLLDDISASGTCDWTDGNLTLDLNGHLLSYNSTSKDVVYVGLTNATSRTTFTLLDSTPGTTHTVRNPLDSGFNPMVEISGGIIYGGSYGLRLKDTTTKFVEFYFQGGTIMAATLDGLYVDSSNASTAVHTFGGATSAYNMRYGINLNACKTISMQNSIISNNGYGGVYGQDYETTLEGGEICNNGGNSQEPTIPPYNYHTGLYMENSSKKISIKNANISNNTAQGVVIKSTGRLQNIDITGTTISSNGIDGSLNGLEAEGQQITITNCTVAQNGSYGAKLEAKINVDVIKSHFDENKGGGIEANVGVMTISNSYLNSNKVNGLTYTGRSLTIISCELNNNSAVGAKLNIADGTATISGSYFNKNGTEGINSNGTLNLGSSFIETNGNSGLYFAGTNVAISDTTLLSNGKSQANAEKIDVTKASNVYITNATEIAIDGCNMAEATGRSILIKSTTVNASITSSAIYSSAGAINAILDGGTVTIEGCEIFDNVTEDEGAGIRIVMTKTASTVTLKTITLTNNTTAVAGGGVYVNLTPTSGNVNINWDGVTASNNTSNGRNESFQDDDTFVCAGGGAYIFAKPAAGTTDVTVANSSFNNNTSNNVGGGLYLDAAANGKSTVTLTGVNANGNKANWNTARSGGGGVFVYARSTTADAVISVAGSTFNNNTSVYIGGGLALRTLPAANGGNGEISMTNVEMNDNKVTNNGYGGLSLHMHKGVDTKGNQTLKIDGAIVQRNTSSTSIGGAYMWIEPADDKDSTCDITIKNMHADYNTSNSAHGAAYLHCLGTAIGNGSDGNIECGDVNVTVEDSSFDHNKVLAGGYAGLYLYARAFLGNSTVSMTRVTMNDNYAYTSYASGQINAYTQKGDYSKIVVTDVEISDNTSATGNMGAGDFVSYNMCNYFNSDQTQVNSAGKKSYIIVKNLTQERNTSVTGWGAGRLLVESWCQPATYSNPATRGESVIDVDGWTVNDNVVTNGYIVGACLYQASGHGTFTVKNLISKGNKQSCSDPNNTTQNYGGGLTIFNGSHCVDVTIKDSVIEGNEAINGAGICLNNSYYIANVTLENVTIKDNTAQQSGGGIYQWGLGGSVATVATVEMIGGTISGNRAAQGGGVAQNAKMSQDDVTFNKFKMSGGATITGNYSNVGGGVFVGPNSHLDLSGDVEIYNNRNANNSKNSNVHLASDNYIVISDKLTNKNPIRLSFDLIYDGMVATSGMKGRATVDNFGLDVGSEADFEIGAAELTIRVSSENPVYVEHKSGLPTGHPSFAAAYAAFDSTKDTAIKLYADVFVNVGDVYDTTTDANRSVTAANGIIVDKEVTLDLNGYMLQPSSDGKIKYLFRVDANGKLTITDSTYGTGDFGKVTHFLTNKLTQLLDEIEGGIINGTVHINGGDVDFQQGHVSSYYGTDVYSNSGMYWTSGNLTMTDDAAVCYAIYGLTINSTSGLSLSGGRFYGNDEYGIMCYGTTGVNSHTLENFKSYGNKIGGVYIGHQTTVTMKRGEIYGNGYRGVTLYAQATFKMESGEIHDIRYNNSDSSGVGVYFDYAVASTSSTTFYSTFEMTGGKISNCYYGVTCYRGNKYNVKIGGTAEIVGTGTGYGLYAREDAAYLTYNPSFTISDSAQIHGFAYGIYSMLPNADGVVNMTGGEIYGNAYGIYLYNYLYKGNTTVNMSGGKIRNNTAWGVYITYYQSYTDTKYHNLHVTATFKMSGGEINNNANGVWLSAADLYYNYLGGTFLDFHCEMNMTGGSVSNNTSYGINLQASSERMYASITLGSGKQINITGNYFDLTLINNWTNNGWPEISKHIGTPSTDTAGYIDKPQCTFSGALAAGSKIGVMSNGSTTLWEETSTRHLIEWNAEYAKNAEFYYDEVFRCLNNGYVYASHDTTLVPTDDPTCTDTGMASYHKCTRCANTFSDEEGTKPVDLSTLVLDTIPHDYIWKPIDNDEYHDKQVCKVCEFVGTASEDHNFTKHQQKAGQDGHYLSTCAKCAYVFESYCVQGGANHTFAGGPLHYATIWTYGNGTHKASICMICQEQNIDLAHVLTGEWLDTTNQTHQQNCVVCGLTNTPEGDEHELDGIWLKSSDGKHYQTCLGCKKVVEVEGQDHELDGVWVKNPTEGIHKQTCNLCKMELEIPNINHSATDWKDSGNGTNHRSTCDMCGLEQVDAHKYGNTWTSSKVGMKDRECTECGYVQSVTCEHANQVAKNSITTHWNECTLCKQHINEQEHTVAEGGWNYMTVSLHHGVCEVCGKDVVANHEPEEKYNENNRNDENHYQICKFCDEVINPQAHDFTWTKDDGDTYTGVCTVCGLTKQKEEHNFSKTLTYDQDNPSLGHFYKCSDCGAIIGLADHNLTWDLSVSGTHKQTCSDGCGYMPIYGAHVYGSYRPVYNEDGTSDSHSRACTYCGTYDNDNNIANKHTNPVPFATETEHGTWCPTCQYVFTSDAHDYVWTDSGDGAHHYLKCDCGDIGITASHVFDKSYTPANDTQHYQTCIRCSGKSTPTSHNTIYVSRLGAGHQATCPTCNWEASKPVDHTYGEYQQGETGHYRNCPTCGYDTPDEVHDYKNSLYYQEALYHYQNCNVCGAEGEHVDHKWTSVTSNKNGTHSAACSECRYSTGADPVDCVFEYVEDSKTDAEHTLKCIVCKWEKTEGHNDSKRNNDDTDHWNECSICGYFDEETAKEPHKWSEKATATADGKQHTFKCDTCGFIGEAKAHNASGSWRNSAEGHWQLCSDCNAAATDPIAHVWSSFEQHLVDRGDGKQSDGTHTGKCTCGWEDKTLKCTFIFDSPEDEHNGYCKDCSALTLMPHVYNIVGGNENIHWLECVCGRHDTSSEKPHEFGTPISKDGINHVYTCYCTIVGQNGDGQTATYKGEYSKEEAHDFDPETTLQKSATKHWYECPACHAMDGQEDHTPATEGGIPQGDGTHDVKCTVCDRTITRDCTYEIGASKGAQFHELECTTCGYKDNGTHTWTLRDSDDDNHWQKCECGEINEETRGAHTPDPDSFESNLNTHTFTCAVCGRTGITKDHEFTGDYLKDAADGHYKICAICNAHSEHETHDKTIAKSNDDGTHTLYCSVCDYKHTDETHDCDFTYADNGDTTHKATCGTCGYSVDKAHEYNTRKTSDTEHWMICDQCKAKDESSVGEHDYKGAYINNGEGKHYRHCEECGYDTKPLDHTINGWQKGDGKHWQECVYCDYESEHNAHIFEGKAVSNNEGKHMQKCSVCGADGELVDCSFVSSITDEGHVATCTECRYSKTEEHDKLAFNYDGTHHWYECSVCGYVKESDKIAHSYELEGNTCDDPNCEQPYVDELAAEKEAAINAINAAAEAAKAKLHSEDKSLFEQMIDKAVKEATDAINHAKDSGLITTTRDECIASIDTIILRDAKTAANAQLAAKAEELIEGLDELPSLYLAQKDTYITAIQNALANAQQLVNDSSIDAIEQVVTNGIASMESAIITTTKTIAQKSINAAASTAKSLVSTGANAEKLQELIDKEAALARTNIANAETVEDIEAARLAGIEILEGFQPESDPDEKQEDYEKRTHECDNKCPDCGKCLTPECDHEDCQDKCPNNGDHHECDNKCPDCGKCLTPNCGHLDCQDKCPNNGDHHECDNKCPVCNKCLTPDCGHLDCQDKCQGHEQEDDHKCDNKCPVCDGCLTDDCGHKACENKCEYAGHHECENKCPECGGCLTDDCGHKACENKCKGHEQEDPLKAAKEAAKNEISAKASAAIAGLIGPNSSTYSAQINEALQRYIDTINGAETQAEIDAAKEAFIAELTAIVKADAIDALEKKAQDAIDSLPADMPEDERKQYEDAIKDELEKAKGEVNDPNTSLEDVTGKVEQSGDDFEDAITDTAKDIAKDKVQKEAQAKKDEIDSNPDLSDEEKKELKDIIDKEAKRAEDNIDNATSREEAEAEQKRGDDILGDIIENPDLAKDKSDARDTLQGESEKKKDEIQKEADEKKKEVDNDPNLSDEEKKAKKDEIQKEADEKKKAVDEASKSAQDDVTKAENQEQIKDAVDKGLEDIDKAGTEPTQKGFLEKIKDFFKNNDMPLGTAAIAVGAMLLLIIILAIAARKPKKK